MYTAIYTSHAKVISLMDQSTLRKSFSTKLYHFLIPEHCADCTWCPSCHTWPILTRLESLSIAWIVHGVCPVTLWLGHESRNTEPLQQLGGVNLRQSCGRGRDSLTGLPAGQGKACKCKPIPKVLIQFQKIFHIKLLKFKNVALLKKFETNIMGAGNEYCRTQKIPITKYL